MSDWKPDQRFIDYFLQQQTRADLDEKVLFVTDGTTRGGEGRSVNDVVAEMQEGTKFGRSFYQSLYDEIGEEYNRSRQ